MLQVSAAPQNTSRSFSSTQAAQGASLTLNPVSAKVEKVVHTEPVIRVLLVEDNPGDARLVKEYLQASEEANYEVYHQESLDGMLTFLFSTQVSAILLDLGLPDAPGGIHTFERVHEMAREVPIIVLTGHDDDELAAAALRAGAQDYIPKAHLETHLLTRTLRYAVERVTASKERQRLRDELHRRERLADIGQAIADVAHGLKTIVGVFQGGVYSLGRGIRVSDWEQVKASHQSLQSSATRAYLLQANLLDYSHHAPKKAEVTRTRSIFEELERMLTPLVEENGKQTKFIFDLPQDSESLYIDSQRLFRSLLNLGTNSVDSMEGRDGEIRFSIRPVEEHDLNYDDPLTFTSQFRDSNNGYYLIEVSDNGLGVQEDVLAQLFRPFYSSKGGRGIGLGLNSVKKFVDDYHGAIRVRSVAGEGTTFQIYLPKPRMAEVLDVTTPVWNPGESYQFES